MKGDKITLGLVGHGKKSEFYFERDKKPLDNFEHKTETILTCF